MAPENRTPAERDSGHPNQPPPLPTPPSPPVDPPPPIPTPRNPAAAMVPTGHDYQDIQYEQIATHRAIIAILYIIGGMLSLGVGFGIAITFCCYPIWVLQIFGGMAGIFIGINMLANKTFPPNKFIAWSFIAGILACDVFTMTIGIVLVFLLENREMKDYYARSGIIY